MNFGLRVRFCVIAMLCLALPATAQLPFSFFVVPVVVKAPGLDGSNWASDFFLTNIGNDTRVFSANYFPENQENTFKGKFAKTGISVRAGETRRVTDVVGTWFPTAGANTKGWLLVADITPTDCEDDGRTTAEAIVATRVYNSVGGGSTYGMIVESSLFAINTSTFPSIFTGIRHQGENAKPGFRTSVGVANISTTWLNVEITLYDSAGAQKGQAVKDIKPLSLRQWSLDKLNFPVLDSDGGRLEVRIVDSNINPCTDTSASVACTDVCNPDCAGSYGFGAVKAIVPYVSNTDNLTGDGETVLPVVDWLGFYAWADQYVEDNCPDEKNSPLMMKFMDQIEPYLDGRHRPPPVFRKIEQ